ncbi:HIRA-interacting protein 3 isoform X2 [Zootoca vivipara]|uniref:HIRA-interacting protein 3 isoform X2 n=1 Tax=Zootoca vivipara TaxID=8524 RepID=UPI00293B9636|nr:HIRA-interacting protein 3 isoform X2 [Zootoca vivipara]
MAAELRSMEAFVRALFQEKPDLSTLTNAIVRKKYLLHAGQKNMAKEQKEQLRQLVDQELHRLEVQEGESANAVVFMAEFKTHINSTSQKRPRCNSHTSGEELEIQELKKQRTGSILISSDDEDSGIDSKKIPLLCGPKHVGDWKSSSSDQRDSGAEGQAGGSESDGQSAKKRRMEQPQRGKGSKPTREQQSRRQREQSGSESKETTEVEQSDPEEIRKQKAAKGQRIKSESDSEQELSNYKPQKKKGFGKQQKRSETVGKGKNRNMDEQRIKKEEELEEDMELPKAGKMCKGGRIDGSESEDEMGSGGKKAQNRPRRRHLKAQEESESEEESESNSEDELPSRQNKMRNSKRSRESEKWSHNSESDSEDDGEFKRQASKGMEKTQKRKELEEIKQGKHKPPKRSTSREELESETNECKSSERKRKGTKKPSSSEDESCSETEEMERGKSKSKVSGSSDESENGSEEWESGKWRKESELKKKGKSVSGSEHSSEEESLRKKGEKSQRKRTIAEKDLETDSEDSGSELVRRKKGLPKTGMQKPQRRREASSSSGDEDEPHSSKRKGKDKEHHSGKQEEHSSIRRLKRYIRECGAHRNYKKLLSGCHSRKAQLKVLKEELENLGLKGAPSLAKCKALKQKREVAAEIASLDLCNIITTQGRPRRQNVWSLYSKPKQLSSPEDSPVHSPIRDWSHLKGVISSDGESD